MSFVKAIGHWILPSSLGFPWRRRKPLAAIVWAHFIAQPGFRDEVRQAMQDLKDGKAVPLKDIPRER